MVTVHRHAARRANSTGLAAAVLAAAGCAGPPDIAAETPAPANQTAASAPLRASDVFRPGPAVRVYATVPLDSTSPLGEPPADATAWHAEAVGPTGPDGRFSMFSHRLGSFEDASAVRPPTGPAGEGAEDESTLVRQLELRRRADGAVVLLGVRTANDETAGGPPFRAFAYDPPLVMIPGVLSPGEPFERSSALIELDSAARAPGVGDAGPDAGSRAGELTRTTRLLTAGESAQLFGPGFADAAVGLAEAVTVRAGPARVQRRGERLIVPPAGQAPASAPRGVVAELQSSSTRVLGLPVSSRRERRVLVAVYPALARPPVIHADTTPAAADSRSKSHSDPQAGG